MAKIKITVPKEISGKWTIHWGKGGTRKRSSSTIIFNAIERQLLRSQLKQKIEIVVKYGKDNNGEIVNETVPSCDRNYLLYSLLCFLEDYLPKDFMTRKIKVYGEKSL